MIGFSDGSELPTRATKAQLISRILSNRKVLIILFCAFLLLVGLIITIVTILLSDSEPPAPTASDFESLLYQTRSTLPFLNSSTYLDWTGAGVYTEEQLEAAFAVLRDSQLCNPHSDSDCALRTARELEAARKRVLAFFGASADAYDVIFTSGATAALKLLAESFDFGAGGAFAYASTAHNSAVGMRELARTQGAPSYVFDPEALLEAGACPRLVAEPAAGVPTGVGARGSVLAVFPAESNLSGRKVPPARWADVRRGLARCFDADVFLAVDAAAFVPTNRLDVAAADGDFFALSFYKMFGFPTGLGALLVRRAPAARLRGAYFGGGTVVLAGSGTDWATPRASLHERFEFGTPDTAGILALGAGFDALERFGIDAIQEHVWALTVAAAAELSALTHLNGAPLVELVGNHARGDADWQGGVLAFRVLTSTGAVMCSNEVSGRAALDGLALRAGCHCNPGECYAASGVSEDDAREFASDADSCSAEPKDDLDLGVVRASLGYLSAREDTQHLARFVAALAD